MNISALLTSKVALGVVGGVGSVATGGLIYHIKWSGTFDGRVSKAIWDLGVNKDWCTRNEDKYVCDKKKNDENLKKIIFASRHNNIDEYKIQGNYSGVEIEIRNTEDRETFPGGIKFVIVKNTTPNQHMQIKRETKLKKTGWSADLIYIWTKEGEMKVEGNKMLWVWEEINVLAPKVGLSCVEYDKTNTANNSTCILPKDRKINIKNGDKVTEEATIDPSKRIGFDRANAGSNFFQGYKFTPKEDIPLGDGKKINGGVEKLEKNKSYQIIRDGKDINKWYLSKVGN